jgi:hypothetical protein
MTVAVWNQKQLIVFKKNQHFFSPSIYSINRHTHYAHCALIFFPSIPNIYFVLIFFSGFFSSRNCVHWISQCFFLRVCVCKFRTNITVRLIRTIIILCCVLWCDLVFSIVEFFLLYFLFFFFFEYALYRLIDKNKQNRNRIFFSRYGKIKLRYLTVSYFHACILLPYVSKINNDALIEIWMRKEVHINQIRRCFFSEIA